MTDIDSNQQLYGLRQRVLAGEEISAEEYAIVIESLRKARTASEPKSGKTKSLPKVKVDLVALMNETLGGKK